MLIPPASVDTVLLGQEPITDRLPRLFALFLKQSAAMLEGSQDLNMPPETSKTELLSTGEHFPQAFEHFHHFKHTGAATCQQGVVLNFFDTVLCCCFGIHGIPVQFMV